MNQIQLLKIKCNFTLILSLIQLIWLMASKYNTIFTIVNLILGTGPIILPSPFYQAGFVLSSLWLILIGLISYIIAQYIIQNISRSHQINSVLMTNPEGQFLLADIHNSSNQDQYKNNYRIVESIQYGKMAKIIIGKKAQIICIVMITLYMFGTIVAKCIITGRILQNVFHDIKFLNSIYFWICVFFLSGSVFSFKQVQNTKLLQLLIIVIRVLTLGFMIGGAIYIIYTFGSQPLNSKPFEFRYFPQLFSNSIYATMCQPSLPSVLSPLRNPKDMKFSIRIGFISSILLLFIISFSGILAFGETLISDSDTNLNYYNYQFKKKLPFVYYFSSFYVFLNVAGIPIYTIVLRKNILSLIAPTINSNVKSRKTIFATLSILTIVLIVVLFAQNYIQYVLDFTSGIIGIFIMILIPSILVIESRKLTASKGKCEYEGFFKNRSLPYLLFCFGLVCLGGNTYLILGRFMKKIYISK